MKFRTHQWSREGADDLLGADRASQRCQALRERYFKGLRLVFRLTWREKTLLEASLSSRRSHLRWRAPRNVLELLAGGFNLTNCPPWARVSGLREHIGEGVWGGQPSEVSLLMQRKFILKLSIRVHNFKIFMGNLEVMNLKLSIYKINQRIPKYS